MEIFYQSRRFYNSYFKICSNYSRYSSVNYSTFSNASPIINRKFDDVKTKFSDVLKWYEHFTGIDEVQAAQNKVIEAQDRFAAAQEKRREITMELNDVKSKIKDLQEELSTTSKGEERFIALITKEHKLLKDEIRLTDKFNLYDREERELFNTLTSAVKDSQKKERIQANKTKYLSIIGSVVGAVLGIVGSTVNNRLKYSEFKKMILKLSEDGKVDLTSLTTRLEESSKKYEEINKNLMAILDVVSKPRAVILNTKEIEQSLKNIENKLNLESSNASVLVNENFETDDFDLLKYLRFSNVKEDVTYFLGSLCSIYFLYLLFVR